MSELVFDQLGGASGDGERIGPGRAEHQVA